MTEDQKKWLSDNPRYSPVRHCPVVSFVNWTDQGYLFASGRFIVDDSKTLFVNVGNAIRVGREYQVV